MPYDFSSYIDLGNEKDSISVKDSKGNSLLTLKAKEDVPYRNFIYWAYLGYLISTLIFLGISYKISVKILEKFGFLFGFSSFIIIVLLLRFFTIQSDFPESITSLEIFKTPFSIDNQYWFYSLGDFLFDITIFGILSAFFVQKSNFKKVSSWNILLKTLLCLFAYTFIITGILLLQITLNGIVQNSDVYFEFEDFSKLEWYSVFALMGILGLLLSYFINANKLIRFVDNAQMPKSIQVVCSCLILLITVWTGIFFFDHYILRTIYTLFFSLSFLFLLQRFSIQNRLSFVWISGWLFFFSFMSTVLLEQANIEKADNSRKEFLKTLISERDSSLEKSFLKLEKSIAEDEFFKLYLSSPYIPYSQVVERLSYLYLDNTFFGRYQYKINIYNSAGFAKRSEHLPLNELRKVLSKSNTTSAKNLFFYSNPQGRFVYWAIISLKNNGMNSGTIAIEISPAPEKEDYSVYIELMSNRIGNLDILNEEMVYALYKENQKIISKNGNFPAYFSNNSIIPKQGDFSKFEENNIKYLLYRDNRDYLSIVQLAPENILKPFSIFSYIFCSGIIALILLFSLVFIINKIYKIKFLHIDFVLSLRERIQQGIVFVTVLSFIAIGIITILYFQDEYNNYHKTRLERKIDSVAKTAAWQILNNSDSIVRIPDAKELSGIHKIDVNIYNIDGELESSSEDAIFGRRLLSRQMNAVAFNKMKNEELDNLTQKEDISKFKYLSGYVPLKDKNNNTVAYLNLPYDFAGIKNLQSQDVAEFLGTLLNVYVILLLLAGFIAYILANSVTRPLSVIGDKLRAISLGSKNEKINWKTGDEDIKEFISRYNKMIDQLEESTKELARTERETVWRQAAKQVAHEIKNPLTPIKLKIQQLEHVAQQDPDKAVKMIKNVSKVITEQIDALSHIASEFSNYGKMPVAVNETFVLNNLVESVYSLFSEEENIHFDINICIERLKIYADQSHIMRVLNNLIKNAIQAIPDDKIGQIVISLDRKNNFALIRISDNGIGVAEDKKENMFSPNFTTKSAGMGLGLSMSKTIISSVNGKIYFESEEGKGTDFYVEIPLSI